MVLGRTNLPHPLPTYLLSFSGDATVTIVHRCTPRDRLKELTSLADIVIAAAGEHRPDTPAAGVSVGGGPTLKSFTETES